MSTYNRLEALPYMAWLGYGRAVSQSVLLLVACVFGRSVHFLTYVRLGRTMNGTTARNTIP